MNKIAIFLFLITAIGCTNKAESQQNETTKTPHKYGGWYCPDNLNGFPPVDFADWKNVPVIIGRLPTKEETQTEASLMYINKEEYPTAKALDIPLPQLAYFHSPYTQRRERIIIIQAIEIDGDSIVGFRYMNGGNGSARYNEVQMMSFIEEHAIPQSKFVSINLKIKNNQDEIWKRIKDEKYLDQLLPTLKPNTNNVDWRKNTNANYYYTERKNQTAAYADKLFGCFYLQNDYQIKSEPYTEKFFLLPSHEENMTELKIVAGPFTDDYDEQYKVLHDWGNKIKELSEQ